MNTAPLEASTPKWLQRTGVILGPLGAVLVFMLLPHEVRDSTGAVVSGLSDAGRATAGAAVLMALWWITEAAPIEATSLLPLVLFPILGITTMEKAAAPYASEQVFLFMGGFMLGAAMERWGLHRRIALVTLSLVGTSPARIVGGLMLATGLISMWVSNTATAIVMLPIGLSVVSLLAEHERTGRADGEPGRDPRGRTSRNFGTCVVLGIAYAASIGGVGTLIGTPPNTLFAGEFHRFTKTEFTFERWLWVGLPLLALFLPLSWLILTKVVFPMGRTPIAGAGSLIRSQRDALGPMKAGEWATLIVFLTAAVWWIMRPQFCQWLGLMGVSADGKPVARLTDGGIAMTAAIVLFLWPVDIKERRFALDWATASRLPWGVLLLFGGGLSLAGAMSATGCDKQVGAMFAGIERLPPWLMILLIATVVTFLSELASNIAVTAAMLPIMHGVELRIGVPTGTLMIPTTLAASCGFMLPVATAANALAYGTGHVSMRSMMRAGFLLDILGIGLITLVTATLGARALIP